MEGVEVVKMSVCLTKKRKPFEPPKKVRSLTGGERERSKAQVALRDQIYIFFYVKTVLSRILEF